MAPMRPRRRRPLLARPTTVSPSSLRRSRFGMSGPNSWGLRNHQPPAILNRPRRLCARRPSQLYLRKHEQGPEQRGGKRRNKTSRDSPRRRRRGGFSLIFSAARRAVVEGVMVVGPPHGGERPQFNSRENFPLPRSATLVGPRGLRKLSELGNLELSGRLGGAKIVAARYCRSKKSAAAALTRRGAPDSRRPEAVPQRAPHGLPRQLEGAGPVCKKWSRNRECDELRVEEMAEFYSAGGYFPLACISRSCPTRAWFATTGTTGERRSMGAPRVKSNV